MNSSNSGQNAVLLIGDFLHEGVSAKIESLGFVLTKLSVKTTGKHWLRVISHIQQLRAAGNRAAIIAYLPTPTLLRIAEMSLDSHKDAIAELVGELKRAPSIVFMHEENLLGNLEPPPWEYQDPDSSEEERFTSLWKQMLTENPDLEADYLAQREMRGKREFRLPTREEWFAENSSVVTQVEHLLRDLTEGGVELVPFKTRNEVTTRITETLEDLDAGLFLRIYVPSGRYQGDQLQDFLDLLSRYFREVEGREFAIDTNATRRGTTYVFRSRDGIAGASDIHDGIRRFDEFMNLSQVDPSRAEAVLVAKGLSATGASELVSKYARSYRRLSLDMRHEWDRKRLTLSQALETDLLDIGDLPTLPPTGELQPSALLSVVGNSGPVMISLSGSQLGLNSNVGHIVGQLVNGNVTYGSDDQVILSRIEAVSDQVEALTLRSALDRLKDEATPPDEKRTAGQRLKTFLIRSSRVTGATAADIGTKLLVKYLEGLITGKNV